MDENEIKKKYGLETEEIHPLTRFTKKPMVKRGRCVRVSLLMPPEMVCEIDKRCNQLMLYKSRTQWILEAVAKALEEKRHEETEN